VNNTFTVTPTMSGVVGNEYFFSISGSYSVITLLYAMEGGTGANELTAGSSDSDSGLAVLRVFMTKEYTAQDYRLVFL
jgi:hypothetical protein